VTATNHTATGILIGAVITQPYLAIPAALASHVVMDALPHFGGDISHTAKRFKIYLAIDCGMAASLLALVFAAAPTGWLLMLVCGIVAASPDLLWIPFWIDELRGKKRRKGNRVTRFLSWIQWGERRWGWTIELVWFAVAAYFVLRLLPR
jgi:hypothetical protein